MGGFYAVYDGCFMMMVFDARCVDGRCVDLVYCTGVSCCFVLPFVGRLMYAIAFLLSPLSPSVLRGSARSPLDGILCSPPKRTSPWWLPYTSAVLVYAVRYRTLCSGFASELRQWP